MTRLFLCFYTKRFNKILAGIKMTINERIWSLKSKLLEGLAIFVSTKITKLKGYSVPT